MTTLDRKPSSSIDSPCPDCDTFLNWSKEKFDSEDEKAVVFRSLIGTVKLNPALDDTLEAKAVKFLESVKLYSQDSSMMVLLSSARQGIIAAAMTILETVMFWISPQVQLTLIKADLIPHLINTINPPPVCLARSSQVLAPSEQYIWHLCVNRYSIVGGEQSMTFLDLIATLLEISPYYQRTMEFVLHLPREWNDKGGKVQQMWKTVQRMLRMEGTEDVIEEKLQNDDNETKGVWIVDKSIKWSNLQGMNLLE
ncbi:hypothetical protein BLNAU_22162 [Blattamonas nauphoetae]|uniref:Uncharacterized protein n=1 Tax=Blattamonas nauphoetae TaxID=2049346 RepID=A0ABQ9WUB2_9EUKA|nr:hypothetical protein BLNAU_22162 [Blattamonas nauphoetae]